MKYLFYALTLSVLALTSAHGMRTTESSNPDLDMARRPCAEDGVAALLQANLASPQETPGSQEIYVMCRHCSKHVIVYENPNIAGRVTRFLAKQSGVAGVLRLFLKR